MCLISLILKHKYLNLNLEINSEIISVNNQITLLLKNLSEYISFGLFIGILVVAVNFCKILQGCLIYIL